MQSCSKHTVKMHYIVQQCLGGSKTSKMAEFSVLRMVGLVLYPLLWQVNINTACVIVREDRQITLRNLSKAFRISYGSVFIIMHDHLHITRICARWVPCLLTPEQKAVQMETCREVLHLFADGGDAFLESALVMNHGCTTMILKENKPAQCGNRRVHQHQKKLKLFHLQGRWWW